MSEQCDIGLIGLAVMGQNLLQAQRDYFGAHTYERTDEEGIFHTDWLRERRTPDS